MKSCDTSTHPALRPFLVSSLVLSMSFESIQTELHFIEAEQRTLLKADSRGTDHIFWSHSPECTLTPTGRCSCSKGIFTSEHFVAFESLLVQNTNVPSNPVQVNIKDKEAITFFSRFIGTFKGLKRTPAGMGCGSTCARRSGCPCGRQITGHSRRQVRRSVSGPQEPPTAKAARSEHARTTRSTSVAA